MRIHPPRCPGRPATTKSATIRLAALGMGGLLLAAAPAHADPATAERLRVEIERVLVEQFSLAGAAGNVALDGAVAVEEDLAGEGRYVVSVPRMVLSSEEGDGVLTEPYEVRLVAVGDDVFEASWEQPRLTWSFPVADGEVLSLTLDYATRDNRALYDLGQQRFRGYQMDWRGVSLSAPSGGAFLTIEEVRGVGTGSDRAGGLVDFSDDTLVRGVEIGDPADPESRVRIGRITVASRLHGMRPGALTEWQRMLVGLGEMAEGTDPRDATEAQRAAARDVVVAMLRSDLLEGGATVITLDDVTARPAGQPPVAIDRLSFGLRGGSGEQPGGMVLDIGIEGAQMAGEAIDALALSLGLRDVPGDALIEVLGQAMLVEQGPEAAAAMAGFGQELLQQVIAAGTAFELRDLQLARRDASLSGEGEIRGAAGSALGALMHASLSLEGIEALEAEFGGTEHGKGIFAILRAFGQPAEGGRLDYVFALDEAGQLTVNQRELLPIIGLFLQGGGQPAQPGPQRRAAMP